MKTNNQNIDLGAIACENCLTLIKTTSDRSGYPQYVGEALVGFETFEDAEKIAERYGLQVSCFYSKNGWKYHYRKGEIDHPLEYTVNDYGDDYSFFYKDDFEYVQDRMIEDLRACSNWKEINEIYKAAEELQEAMNNLKDDEVVVVVNNLEVYEITKIHTTCKSYDNEIWMIGVESKW